MKQRGRSICTKGILLFVQVLGHLGQVYRKETSSWGQTPIACSHIKMLKCELYLDFVILCDKIPSLTLLKEYKVCNAVDKLVTDSNSITEKCVIFLVF